MLALRWLRFLILTGQVAIVTIAFGQTTVPNAMTPATTTGIPPYSTQDGTKENVALATGDLDLYIPLLSLTQKSGWKFQLGVFL
jgi:hypothetical protein